MTDFASAVAGWRDYYMLAGTSAATLMGLLFVATSLKLDVLTDKANAETRARVSNSFEGFLYVLLFALIFMIPEADPESLGIPLFIFSVIRLISVEKRAWQAYVARSRKLWNWDTLVAYQMPGASYLLVTGYTWPMIMGHTDTHGFGWFVGITMTLLGSATVSAWRLMLEGSLAERAARKAEEEKVKNDHVALETSTAREVETKRLR